MLIYVAKELWHYGRKNRYVELGRTLMYSNVLILYQKEIKEAVNPTVNPGPFLQR